MAALAFVLLLATKARSPEAEVPLRAFVTSWPIPDDEDLRGGLVGEYFHTGQAITDFPKLGKDAKPRFKRIDRQIDFLNTGEAFGGTKLKDHFYVRWTGFLRVPKDGRYKLYTVSDDGSRLFIDGKKVVDNGGVHSMHEASGEIELKKGDREILLEYFEGEGHAGLRLLWEGPDLRKDVIPAKALFHARKRSPTEEERKGIALDVEPPRREEAKPKEAARREEKKEEAPEPPPEKPKLPPLDARVVKDGEARPDVIGRVVNAFDDGPSTLLLVRTSKGETPFYLYADARRVFVGLPRDQQRPSPNQHVYLWLKPGSEDQVREARFFK